MILKNPSMQFGLVGAMMLVFGASAVEGQMPMLATGTRVRVEIAESKTIFDGTLLSQTADSLVVESPTGIWTIPASSVGRMRTGAGRSYSRGAIRGMVIGGAVTGVAAGIAFGAYLAPRGGGVEDIPTIAAVVLPLAFEGAMLGGIIGAITGAEKWTTIYSRTVAMTVLPLQHGTGMGLSVRF